METEIKKQNWFRRHWIVSIFLGLIVLGIFNSFLLSITGNTVDENQNNADLTGNVVNEQVDESPTETTTTKTIYVCPDGSQVSDSSQCSSASAQTQENTQNNVQNTQTTTTPTTTPAVEEQSDKATIGEKNALSKALSYLDFMAFSYSGLIKQLEFEGFTHQEAVYGVDNCGADWNEQATLKAKSYLDMMAFSREGLIEQLEYEGFTGAQAEYGVQAVGY